MNRINKVFIKGDIVEVECRIDGITKSVRRHVQNYDQLTIDEKKKLWFEIAEIPYVEYKHSLNPLKKFLSFIRLKKKVL